MNLLFKINRRKIFKKIDKAIKNNKVIVVNNKYRQLGITTKLLELCIKTDSKLVVNSTTMAMAISYQAFDYGQLFSNIFSTLSVDDIYDHIIAIGTITGNKHYFNGKKVKIIVDNSINYKDFKSLLNCDSFRRARATVELLTGVVYEDYQDMEYIDAFIK